MADEELPCFEFGFDFLQVERSIEVDESPGEPVTEKKNWFADHTETDRNQLLVENQAKATKSKTNWAVKAFKGKERQKVMCKWTTHEQTCQTLQFKMIFIEQYK